MSDALVSTPGGTARPRPAWDDPEPDPAPEPAVSRRRAWLTAIAIGLAWAVGVRVVAFLVATGSRWMLQEGSRGPRPLGDWLSTWSRWDAVNLLELAEHGYLSDTADPAYPQHGTAFFPGFPLAVRAVGWLVGDLRLAGLLVSFLACAVAFTMLYRLADHYRGPGTGTIAVPLLACSPAGVFLIAGYSEALFLAGAITAWYLAATGRWWLAGVAAGLAVGTRTVGVALVAGLGVHYLVTRRFRLRPDVLALGVALLPLGAWMYWLAWQAGDPLRFVADQRDGWGRQLTDPGSALRTTMRGALGNADTTWVFTWRLELVGAVIGLVLLVWCLRRAAWGWATYTAITMAAYLLSTWYFSIPRGLLGLFPLPILLAGVLRGRPQVTAAVLAASAALWALGVAVFVRGPWVG